MSLAKVERHVGDLVDRGGRVLAGGRRHKLGRTFFEPTIVTGLDQSAAMWREETFGPVAGITSFGDEQEAIDLANDTEYGLLGFVFTRDLGRTWRVSEALETGMVAVNAAASPARWHRSAASRSRASAVKGRSTGLRTGLKSST
jgi:succinate-semialdehyde dehydrogenase/glutarate-semialdehyde dehydrogenase